ncbi:hypothetical protein [Streptomyces sp. NPDC046759]|uniref:hypothetical protein n=1 Tax=Streptomyces sp. NPDC046759 TaxID=3155019 RepID=UPI0033D45470
MRRRSFRTSAPLALWGVSPSSSSGSSPRCTPTARAIARCGGRSPDELIKLERSAEEARARLAGLTGKEYDAQWRRWREASEAAQAAITAQAEASGENRYDLEQGVKKAVRHAEEDPAE